MRGAWKHWTVRGYHRLAQQAIYFAVPLGMGASPFSCALFLATERGADARGLRSTGYGLLSWAIKDNALRNSKEGQAKGLFP